MTYRDSLDAAQARARALEAALEDGRPGGDEFHRLAFRLAQAEAELARSRQRQHAERDEQRAALAVAGVRAQEAERAQREVRGLRAECEALRDQIRRRLDDLDLTRGAIRTISVSANKLEQERAELLGEVEALRAARDEALSRAAELHETLAAERTAHAATLSRLRRAELERWARVGWAGGPTGAERMLDGTGEGSDESQLARFRERFGPRALAAANDGELASRLRDLVGRLARSVWIESRALDMAPALMVLNAAGHVLAPRRNATLGLEFGDDGVRLTLFGPPSWRASLHWEGGYAVERLAAGH